MLRSSAFENRDEIPERYTCEGDDISPPLTWQNVPEGTESLVLIVDDPDAPNGTFTHWVVYNIPPLTNALPEGFSPREDQAEGAQEDLREGRNDFGKVGYGGPCPPTRDDAHRYHFRLYALDTNLNLAPGANRGQLFELMHDHVLDETELVGAFERSLGP